MGVHDNGDAELIRQAQRAWAEYDKRFASLWQLHRAHVENFCARILNNAEAGHDAATEVYILARLHFGKLKAGEAFVTWLFRIAVRYCLNHKKLKKNQPADSLDDENAYLQKWIAFRDLGIESVISSDQWSEIQQRAKAELEDKDLLLFRLITAEREDETSVASIAELSRLSGIARSTVQYRLDKLRSWFDRIQKELLNC